MTTLSRETKVAGLTVILAIGTLLGASCGSLSEEQRIANEQSRLRQQEKGYPDRENSAQQKVDDAKAEWQRQQRKKS